MHAIIGGITIFAYTMLILIVLYFLGILSLMWSGLCWIGYGIYCLLFSAFSKFNYCLAGAAVTWNRLITRKKKVVGSLTLILFFVLLYFTIIGISETGKFGLFAIIAETIYLMIRDMPILFKRMLTIKRVPKTGPPKVHKPSKVE